MTRRTVDVRRFLASTAPFEGARAEELEPLVQQTTVRTLAGGETLALRGRAVGQVCGISSGFLKAFVLSARGRCFLGDIAGPGEWLGLAPALRNGARDFDLRAGTETQVVLIGATAFNETLERVPGGDRAVTLLVSERYERALELLRSHAFHDAEGRLALRVMQLLERHGERVGAGLRLPFRLSQEELGQMIGITREAVGRCLRAWESAGFVELSYAALVVREPDALEALFRASEADAVEPFPERLS